jgi:hypothetical protein
LDKINIKIDKGTHRQLHRVQADMEIRSEDSVTFSGTIDRLIELYDRQAQIAPEPARQVTRPARAG